MLDDISELDISELNENSTFVEEEKALDEEDLYPFPTVEEAPTSKRFLGMTPGQLFVISIEFFFMVLIIGAFFMIVTEKMIIPF